MKQIWFQAWHLGDLDALRARRTRRHRQPADPRRRRRHRFSNEHEDAVPSLTYKIVFDIGKASPKIDDVNPGLTAISRYYNTSRQRRRPCRPQKIRGGISSEGTDFALTMKPSKPARTATTIPNISLMRSMKHAGIGLRVCGQESWDRKSRCPQIMPEVQVDQWA